jgi:hypothetical protein
VRCLHISLPLFGSVDGWRERCVAAFVTGLSERIRKRRQWFNVKFLRSWVSVGHLEDEADSAVAIPSAQRL